MFKSFYATLVAFCVALVLVAAPAHAVVITVSGTDYDVQFYDSSVDGSWNTINTNNSNVLLNTPWFGNSATALSFEDAYRTQVSTPYPFDTNAGTNNDILAFGYNANVDAAVVYDSGTIHGLAAALDATSTSSSLKWAYTVATVSAPEIDAHALSKALFALFALGVWLIAARGRPDGLV